MSSEAHPNEGSTAEPSSAHDHGQASALGSTGSCPTCGNALDEHNRHLRFTLPDPVLAAPERERTPGTWMSDETAHTSELLMVPNEGAYVRATLPIKLTGGYTVSYGVWLLVHPGDWKPICDTWWKPAYADLRISGWLANTIPPFDIFAAPVLAVVRSPTQLPRCHLSTDPLLDRVLYDEWPHELFLDHLGRA
ncbi:DUF2199 domain-containing protein [Nocardia sp. NPDC050175]|uniref:DUF2199 domain-containing protein n=1 Tax=Nocardia sp. NPDC050175 TaxID=3364317 RepID=UPI00378C9DE6